MVVTVYAAPELATVPFDVFIVLISTPFSDGSFALHKCFWWDGTNQGHLFIVVGVRSLSRGNLPQECFHVLGFHIAGPSIIWFGMLLVYCSQNDATTGAYKLDIKWLKMMCRSF
ncbi:hypothetical protein K492DRAFT_181806 [Lichtheimia hyalospora FSU 10163]|nr:hypothetical protein K492DRAFT_181806 [Lichtheimia hyalospora FSU 10163]